MGPKEITRKNKSFVLGASMYAVGSMSSMDASKRRVQRDDSAMPAICVWARIEDYYIAK
jgi:hypothetical protein